MQAKGDWTSYLWPCGCFHKFELVFVAVLVIRAPLFGGDYKAPDCWKLAYGSPQGRRDVGYLGCLKRLLGVSSGSSIRVVLGAWSTALPQEPQKGQVLSGRVSTFYSILLYYIILNRIIL